jgi:hypothetical protein
MRERAECLLNPREGQFSKLKGKDTPRRGDRSRRCFGCTAPRMVKDLQVSREDEFTRRSASHES